MSYQEIYKLMRKLGFSESQADDTATYFEGMSKKQILIFANALNKENGNG